MKSGRKGRPKIQAPEQLNTAKCDTELMLWLFLCRQIQQNCKLQVADIRQGANNGHTLSKNQLCFLAEVALVFGKNLIVLLCCWVCALR